MKVLLILMLFLVGCGSQPGLNRDNLRKLGEMRSISIIPQGNNVFLYDFEGLGLNLSEFNSLTSYYYDIQQNILLGIYLYHYSENVVRWRSWDKNYFSDVSASSNHFKQYLKTIDLLNTTDKVSIQFIENNQSVAYYYKGFSASGEVQLVGISKIGTNYVCYEGECNMHSPYVPIPVPIFP